MSKRIPQLEPVPAEQLMAEQGITEPQGLANLAGDLPDDEATRRWLEAIFEE